MNHSHSLQCEDQKMGEILALAERDTDQALAAIEAVQREFPQDARLHFLFGSLLIGKKRFVGAHEALARAVALAPDFALARFQLGFFELTSGEANAALRTWSPLVEQLPEDHYLRLFVKGLEHLIADRFAECQIALQAGIAGNIDNLPLNTDMQLIIDKCEEHIGEGIHSEEAQADSAISATSLLLNRSLKH